MLNTTQAAALHAFNTTANQGRLTETSLARALKADKVVARNAINSLREKAFVTNAGMYEFRITEAGKKHLKTLATDKRLTTTEKPADLTDDFIKQVMQCAAGLTSSFAVTKVATLLGANTEKTRQALDHLTAAGFLNGYQNGTYYANQAGRELAASYVQKTMPAERAQQCAKELAPVAEVKPAEVQPEPAAEQPADTSLLALHDAKAQTEPATASTAEEVTDVDIATAELIEDGIVKVDGDMLQLNEPAGTKALLDAELTSLAEQLDPDQFPVIDDIDTKQHALAGIAVLLKQRTPALARLADQLATDLSVIRLHQERRA